MTDSTDYAIEVAALSKRYGELCAVNDVSFTVSRGEVFAFLGPNGAGKTTTVEIIATVRIPTSGSVSVLGMDVITMRQSIIPRIGVLPQGFSSFDRITVSESISYYSQLFGGTRADIESLMDLTDLRDKRDVQFKNLSGGLKQRLGIAIALVNDPEVVFLDEPTTGLDPHARRAVWDVLLGLKSQGKTVFITTHYMEEAELLADTVAIISRGRIVATGSPGELIERNANHMVLTLKSADERTFALLKNMGHDPARDDHHNLKVTVQRTEDVHAILSAVQSHGTALPGLDVRKPNLEEVFLTLTGEPLKQDDAGALLEAVR
jgi:ABC-2 type transport system ATP-binding protein